MKLWILMAGLSLMACQNAKNNRAGADSTAAIAPADTGQPASMAPADSPAFAETQVPLEQLIVPGQSIGKTPLGLDASLLEQRLGRPDFSDAAMGKAWLTWNGKRDEHNNRTELNIYTTYKDSTMQTKVVRQIRTTSSYFKTKENMGVYRSLDELQKHFPNLKAVGHYKDGSRTITIYDAARYGIAFEAAAANGQEICTGVIVHPKGKEVLDVYLYFRPEVERMEE